MTNLEWDDFLMISFEDIFRTRRDKIIVVGGGDATLISAQKFDEIKKKKI